MAATTKLEIATELLDRALRLYFEGDSYFSALHLAGAAEELLGVYVKTYGGVRSFDSTKDSAVRLSKYIRNDGTESNPKDIADLINHAKNSTKHKYGKGDHITDFDPRFEAFNMLDLAVENYYQLMSHIDLPDTELLRRFNNARPSLAPTKL